MLLARYNRAIWCWIGRGTTLLGPAGACRPMRAVTERDRVGVRYPLDGTRRADTHFAVHSLEGFGIAAGDGDAAVGAREHCSASLARAAARGHRPAHAPLADTRRRDDAADKMTRRNLESWSRCGDADAPKSGARGASGDTAGVLDRDADPDARRAAAAWLLAPLLDRVQRPPPRRRVALRVRRAGRADRARRWRACATWRLAGKTAAGRCDTRELRALGDSLDRLPRLERRGSRGRPARSMASWNVGLAAPTLLVIGAWLWSARR